MVTLASILIKPSKETSPKKQIDFKYKGSLPGAGYAKVVSEPLEGSGRKNTLLVGLNLDSATAHVRLNSSRTNPDAILSSSYRAVSTGQPDRAIRF